VEPHRVSFRKTQRESVRGAIVASVVGGVVLALLAIVAGQVDQHRADSPAAKPSRHMASLADMSPVLRRAQTQTETPQ